MLKYHHLYWLKMPIFNSRIMRLYYKRRLRQHSSKTQMCKYICIRSLIYSIVRTCKTYLTPTLNSLRLFITGLHIRNIHQGSSSTIIMILMRNTTHHFVCKTEPVTRLPVGGHRFVSFDITSSGRWQSELNYGLPATSVWSHNRSVNLESISRRMRYQTCPVVPPHYV